MSDSVEVLFVSDSSGRVQSLNCVNPHIGTNLIAYRNGNGVSKGTLSLVGSDYLMSGDSGKPILHVWPLNSEEPLSNFRMVVAGKVSSLAVTPNGVYCAAAIDSKIYIWNTSSGYLLKVLSRHYQPVSKVAFSHDCSYLVTAGEDGLVLVWRLANVLAKETGNVFEASAAAGAQPLHCLSQHALPVTNLHLGHGNLRAHLFTVSADQTCKIFSLVSGKLLASIVFNFILTSVVVNDMETELFVGTNCGKIRSFALDPYPERAEHHVRESPEEAQFGGHAKAVNFLALSLDGTSLASGSDDEKVMLWHIPSKQLLRTFEMKGPVTGLFFRSSPRNLFRSDFKPDIVLSNFEKASAPERNDLEVTVNVRDDLEPFSTWSEFPTRKRSTAEMPRSEEEDVASLKSEIKRLQDANKQLYQFAMREILKNPLALGAQRKCETDEDPAEKRTKTNC